MHLEGQEALYGPNLFTSERAVRLRLRTAEADLLTAGARSQAIAQRLAAVLPDDVSLWRGEAAGAPLSLAILAGHLALCLQEEFGYRLRHCSQRAGARPGTAEVVHACADPQLGLLAGRVAVALVARALAEDAPDRLAAAFQRGLEALRRDALIVSTRCSVWEAERRGISWSRIAHADGTVRLGQGHKQRCLRGGYLHQTSFLAARLAINKAATSELLRSAGIPVPDSRLVTDEAGAVAAAQAIGYPVVTKPNARDMGTAVSIGLADSEAVREGFRRAARHGPVQVERQMVGLDYRVTVLHGRMIAAGCDIAAHVVGDGRATVQALIDAINREPRRGLRDYIPLKTIRPDAVILATLQNQGYDLDSVPPAGTRVALRHWWKVANDHTAEDATDSVHPENRAMLERAVRLVGLDLAGIDFITPDIARPWHEVGGAINEVNPTPGMRTHVRAGTPDVHRIVVEGLFPPGDDGRIPLAAVVAAPGAAKVAERVAALLEAAGHTVGVASSEGVTIAGHRVSGAAATGPHGARLVLEDPLDSAAVVEVSEQATAARGLGFDVASVIAVMAAPQSADVAALVLATATALAVLNAELPEIVALADARRTAPLAWVARDPQKGPLPAHVSAGGVAVAFDASAGAALLWSAGECRAIPLQIENDAVLPLLFTAAVAHGLGLPAEMIARYLKPADAPFTARRNTP